MIDLQKLRIARAKKNMSQKDVADRVGITQTYYSRIEVGSRDGSLSTLMAICKALDLSISEVLIEEANPTPPSAAEPRAEAERTA
mgnify:CR=1 FL=1